jgi:hypothetical protein
MDTVRLHQQWALVVYEIPWPTPVVQAAQVSMLAVYDPDAPEPPPGGAARITQLCQIVG